MLVLASTRSEIADYVAALFRVYSLLILAYIVLRLVFAFARNLPYNRVLDKVYAFLRDVSEPLLAPFRRVLPSFGGFDFSPILALVALGIVGSVVVSLIRG